VLVIGALLTAMPALAEGASELEVLEILQDRDPARVGQPLIFTITYKNAGQATLPASTSFDLSITLTSADGTEQGCSAAVTLESDLPPDDQRGFTFRECQIIPPLAGNYQLVASVDDQPMARPQTLKVEESESALPEDLSRLFVGLGMFIAMMMVMAVGTEVVIDSCKVVLGMKRKVTSLESLEKMEKMLPGQLAAVGAGAASQAQITKLIGDLQDTLEPVHQVRQAALAIQAGQFQEAFDLIVSLIPAEDQKVAAAKLEELKTRSGELLKKGLDQLTEDLGISQALANGLKREIETEISRLVSVDSSLGFLERIFDVLQTARHQLVGEWLRGQRENLLTKSREQIMDLFDQQVGQALLGLGLKDRHVQMARQKVELVLAAVDAKAMASTEAYIASVEKLLRSVEQRRNQIQSPVRKLWRHLRRDRFGGVWIALGMAIASFPIGWWVLAGRLTLQWAVEFGLGLLIGVGVGGVAWLLIEGLAALGALAYRRMNKGKLDVDPILSQLATLHKVELLWNIVSLSPDLDPLKYGEPRGVADLDVTTVASEVLESSDFHRDQERSRLRWLRVISVFVGVILAYLLQIDAAKLLDAAVPGIANTINVFRYELFTGLDLTPGILLTAMAASAGSAFWHDQLKRLQYAKKQAEAVATMVQQVKSTVEGEG
jgi:aminoglycoside phosphotransferase